MFNIVYLLCHGVKFFICVNLLGFNNGIYDLVNEEFRNGRPEDLISIIVYGSNLQAT